MKVSPQGGVVRRVLFTGTYTVHPSGLTGQQSELFPITLKVGIGIDHDDNKIEDGSCV